MNAAPGDIEREGGLDFWFEFASTYSYLTARRIQEMAAGVVVRWRPFLLGPIFASQGWNTSPFEIYPAKGRYMWQDVARIAQSRGLPFAKPAQFPQNGLLAARTALAALEVDPHAAEAFCIEIFRAQFERGQVISDPATIRTALGHAALPERLLEAAQAPEIKTALRDQTARAVDLGLFGAPSFVAGDALFWGDDRLEAALDHAAGTASGRAGA